MDCEVAAMVTNPSYLARAEQRLAEVALEEEADRVAIVYLLPAQHPTPRLERVAAFYIIP